MLMSSMELVHVDLLYFHSQGGKQEQINVRRERKIKEVYKIHTKDVTA
jgi:hypothetical protein